MNKNPLDKVDSLKNMVVWTQVLLITVAICIPGIIISLQYSTDECVKKSVVNIELDEWLLIAAICHLFVIISFLPVVCCVWKHKCIRVIPLVFICMLFIWGTIGTYLIIESDLNNCSHDSLWIMSLIEIIFVFGFIAIYVAIQINSCFSDSSSSQQNTSKSCCGCCGFDVFKNTTQTSQTDSDDEESVKWLLNNNLDTFRINAE